MQAQKSIERPSPAAAGGNGLTHVSLCALAVKWLKRPESAKGPGCTIAVSECSGGIGEIPDAIGWRSCGSDQHSVLVEVKISRSDFLTDARKPHRRAPADGMGQFRYFMAPQGLIGAQELPKGWGLVEVNPRGGLKVRCGHVLAKRQPELNWMRDFSTWEHEHSAKRETAMLVRLLARVGDADELQRRLKIANNLLNQSNRRNEDLSKQLAASRERWALHRQSEPTYHHATATPKAAVLGFQGGAA